MMSILSKLDANTLPYSVREIQGNTQAVIAKAFNQNQLGYKQTTELDRLSLKTHHIGEALELNTIARRAICNDVLGKMNRQLDAVTVEHPSFTETLNTAREGLLKLPQQPEAFRVNNTYQKLERLMAEPQIIVEPSKPFLLKHWFSRFA
jgi:hypothetical protein